MTATSRPSTSAPVCRQCGSDLRDAPPGGLCLQCALIARHEPDDPVPVSTRWTLGLLPHGQAVRLSSHLALDHGADTPRVLTGRLTQLARTPARFPSEVRRAAGSDLADGAYVRVGGRVDQRGPAPAVAADWVTRDRQAETPPPQLPGGPYVPGMGGDARWHAVTRPEAFEARYRAEASDPPHRADALALCGTSTTLIPHRGPFDRATIPARADVCPTCAWTVATDTGATDAEIAAMTPTGRTRAALARAAGDPGLAARVCEAVLAAARSGHSEHEVDHPATIQILAHVTAHAPVLLLPEDCPQGDCDHRPDDLPWDDTSWRCPWPDATAACPACSLQAGGWAGEWAGQLMDECPVDAPCQVLRTVAGHYRVAVDGSQGGADGGTVR